jgi:hypothetical protein
LVIQVTVGTRKEKTYPGVKDVQGEFFVGKKAVILDVLVREPLGEIGLKQFLALGPQDL